MDLYTIELWLNPWEGKREPGKLKDLSIQRKKKSKSDSRSSGGIFYAKDLEASIIWGFL